MSEPPPVSPRANLQCPQCWSPLSVESPVDSLNGRCPVCRTRFEATLFPRFYGASLEEEPDLPAAEGEAACSFFPQWRAVAVCDECGSFLSHRASLEWSARVLCLPCLHRLREVEQRPDCLARARHNDRLALALVTWLAPLTLFTAPVALFLLLRQRSRPASLVPRGRALWWIALGLSGGWIAFWIFVFIAWISLVRQNFL